MIINYQKTFLLVTIFTLFSVCLNSCNVPIEDSFKEITGEDLPKNAQVINKEDSQTDFHGDYGRILLIKVDTDFYNSLPKKIIQKGFREDTESPRIGEFKDAQSYIKQTEIVSQYQYSNNSIYYYVGFYSDKETLVLIRTSW